MKKVFLLCILVNVVFLSSFKVLIVTAPGKENFYVTSWRGGRCFDRLATKTDHQCQLRGSNPRPHPYHGCALPTELNRQQCASKRARRLTWLIVCHYRRLFVHACDNSISHFLQMRKRKSKDFRKEKGVWGKAPFRVFWRMPKHKKDKKKAFRLFFLIIIRHSQW